MSVRLIVHSALIGALELTVFTAFSGILYLEAVTFTIVCVALCFDRRTAVFSSVCFCILNMVLIQGITPWSLMYLAIYPVYSLIVSGLQKYRLSRLQAALVTGFLSFLTGQLLQIPWLMVSRILAAGYLLLGLQTSLIQGGLSAALTWCLFEPVCKILRQIAGNRQTGRTPSK